MTIRDINFWGFVKIMLFINIVFPLLLLIPIGVLDLLNVPGFNLSFYGDTDVKLFGMVKLEIAGPPLWITILIIGTLNLLLFSKVLQLLAKYTPLGRVKIG